MTTCMCCGAAYFTEGTAWDACADCIAERLKMLLQVSAGVGRRPVQRAGSVEDDVAERVPSLPHRMAG